jgi:hypothetical protein
MVAIYIRTVCGATWHYFFYSRISIPLLKITFCFYTASAELGSTVITINIMMAIQRTSTPPEIGRSESPHSPSPETAHPGADAKLKF